MAGLCQALRAVAIGGRSAGPGRIVPAGPLAYSRARMAGLDLTLIVPTLNERDNVAALAAEAAAALKGLAWELVFADSASDDGTPAAVAALAAAGQPVRLLGLPRSASLSAACIAAMEESRAELLAVCDADLQHDLTVLPRLVAALRGGASLAVGSRYVRGGGTGSGLKPHRWLLSRGATLATRLSLGVRLADPMSGFFALRRADFLAARGRLAGSGFKILLDLILALDDPKVVEVPYVMRPRHAGESKLGLGVLWAALRQLGAGALRRHRARPARRP